MRAASNNFAPKGLRGWWASPPRTGMRRIIAPFEYRHLRAFARVRIISGFALVAFAGLTLGFGGSDWKAYGWAMAFLALAAGNWGFAYWELNIARSEASRA